MQQTEAIKMQSQSIKRKKKKKTPLNSKEFILNVIQARNQMRNL